MPEIYYVTAQISPSQVAEGFYTVEDGVLTMVYGNGDPVLLFPGTEVERKVQRNIGPNDNPKAIANILTKEIRRTFRDEKVEGFSGPIQYANAGWR